MRAAAFMAVTVLAGCASTIDPGPTMQQEVATLNARFAGRPAADMLAIYGQPASSFDAAGGIRVLQWGSDGTLRLHENVTSTTTGAIGDRTAYPGARPVPYAQTTTTREGYNVDVHCVMQAGVRSDGTVDRVGLGGQMGACENFLR